MSEIAGSDAVDNLCKRLAETQEVFLPVKHSDGDIPTISVDQKQISEDSTEKSVSLKNYFVQNPLNFLRRYHRHIKPREIQCFNDISDNLEIAYYIRKICQNEDLTSRTEMNSRYMSNQVKNRRYKALQRMINEGDYFSEESMKKRCPYLYDYYIGRFLTDEEREEKLRDKASAQPSNLSEFFMDVIEQKQECEELRSDEEEFEEEEEEDEDEQRPAVPMMEKAYLVEEFKSRMYQRFLDGFDKYFQYDTVDSNPEYDDDTQIERDAEDDYFDDEEPGNEVQEDTTPNHNDSESEDELDAYMRQLENDSSGKAREESDKNQEKS